MLSILFQQLVSMKVACTDDAVLETQDYRGFLQFLPFYDIINSNISHVLAYLKRITSTKYADKQKVEITGTTFAQVKVHC